MRVLLLGGSGMVGDGVLHQCLRDDRVESVLSLGRSELEIRHAKLEQRLHSDFSDYSELEDRLGSIDACFFCLGVSSAGMSEAEYSRITYGYTMAAAEALSRANPGATFCHVSGEGTDSSEKGRSMWARVKGRTENAVLALPLDAWMFRPGFIRPRPGKKSKTRLYRVLYSVLNPAYPLLRRLAPTHVTTVEAVGNAMIAVARSGYPSRILENPDINRLGQPSADQKA